MVNIQFTVNLGIQFTVYIDDPYKTIASMADSEMIRAAELLTREFDDNP